MKKLTKEIQNLNERTGVRCLLLASKTHVDDQFAPTMVEVNGSSSFFTDVLKIPADQGLRQYQQHNCSVTNAPSTPSNVNERQRFIADKIREGLVLITNGACTAMEYVKYDGIIRVGHGVELTGWPMGLPFQSLTKFTNNATLKNLIRLLDKKILRWVSMSEDEVNRLTAKVAEEAVVAAATKVAGKRKRRSDSGVTRGPSKKAKNSKSLTTTGTGSTPSASARRRSTNITAQLPPSRPTIDNSDEEQEPEQLDSERPS